MRTIGGTLAGKIAQDVTTLARLWSVTRRDGVVYRFTDHDQDISFGGHDYLANVGFTASTILAAVGTQVQGVTMTTAVADATGRISASDVYSGVLDKGQCLLLVVDWFDPDGSGSMTLFGGEVLSVELDDEQRAVIEISGLLASGRYINVESYSTTCRADLGDARCKFDIDSLKEDFTVATVANTQKVTTSELNQASEFWTLGVLHWLTGNNAGIAMEVRKSTMGDLSIETFLPSPFPVQVGDTGEVWPGCDKSTTMCHDRYDNILNYRGEPFIAPPETTSGSLA